MAGTQIDDPSRGFSYRRPGPLDMLDPTRGQPASALLNRLSEPELADACSNSATRPTPRRSPASSSSAQFHPVTTTEQLTEIVCEARDFTRKRAAGGSSTRRPHISRRILVNRELANLDRLLAVISQSLAPGGVAAIISFHSGEDRRVKDAFRTGLRAGVYARSADRSPPPKTSENPRSRSAKLRRRAVG